MLIWSSLSLKDDLSFWREVTTPREVSLPLSNAKLKLLANDSLLINAEGLRKELKIFLFPWLEDFWVRAEAFVDLSFDPSLSFDDIFFFGFDEVEAKFQKILVVLLKASFLCCFFPESERNGARSVIPSAIFVLEIGFGVSFSNPTFLGSLCLAFVWLVPMAVLECLPLNLGPVKYRLPEGVSGEKFTFDFEAVEVLTGGT